MSNVFTSTASIISHVLLILSSLDYSKTLRRKHWGHFSKQATDIRCISHLKDRIKPLFLRWKSPKHGRFKLNVDGSCTFKGESAGGAIIRDSDGDIVAGCGRVYGKGSPLIAESRALLDGLILCEKLGLRRVDIEIDSMVLVELIQYGNSPWFLELLLNCCRKAIKSEMVVYHIFREQNLGADWVAKEVLKNHHDMEFTKVNAPPKLKAIAYLEKMNLRYLRLID